MSDALALALASTPEMRVAVGDEALVRAMLRAEAALALECAAAGVIATEAGTAIAAACEHLTPDVDALCRSAVESATPVIALVAALRDALPESSAVHVHRGATSQDIVDTAVVLVVRTALALVEGSLAAAVDAAATLADEHRATVMCGRTLLQQAAPTTFGLKAAGWMLDLLDASEQVGDARCVRLPAQLGGAVGTLAAFGPAALAVADGFATRLDLPAPLLPWHTRRRGIVATAVALASASAACEKVATDVLLLAQTEVGEVRERRGCGGGSSTLPQKRNPVAAVAVRAASRRALASAATLVIHEPHEHERAAGAWQVEWSTLRDALLATHAATTRTAELLDGLEVDADRMSANLALDGGTIMAEAASTALADELGWSQAQEVVRRAAGRARASGRSLRGELLDAPQIAGAVDAARLDEVLDPRRYTGAANELIDRALAYRRASR